jgi:hypothetical protein
MDYCAGRVLQGRLNMKNSAAAGAYAWPKQKQQPAAAPYVVCCIVVKASVFK